GQIVAPNDVAVVWIQTARLAGRGHGENAERALEHRITVKRRRADDRGPERATPAFLAVGSTDAMDLPIPAAEVDPVSVDGRRGNHPVGNLDLPFLLAGLQVETLQSAAGFLVVLKNVSVAGSYIEEAVLDNRCGPDGKGGGGFPLRFAVFGVEAED